MTRLIHILTFLAGIILFSNCGQKGTTITGTISDAANLTIFLDKLDMETTSIANRTEADGNGTFNMNFPEGLNEGLYRIRAGAKAAHLILKGNEKVVKVTGKMEDLSNDKYEVMGSPSTQKYLDIMGEYKDGSISKDQLSAKINKVDPVVALLLTLRSFPARPEFAKTHLEVANRLKAEKPDFDLTEGFYRSALSLDQARKRMEALQKIRVGEKAPDIALSNPYGKEMKLSDLKGKVVLLDFWASWCGPCRRENPKVVKTYDKYKNQGFTVFSVSLDGLDKKTEKRYNDVASLEQNRKRQKDRWIKAIEDDNLKWETHVSDLRKWDSEAAALYGVRSIPQTFLIDRDGTIAAVNPRYNLEEEVIKLL